MCLCKLRYWMYCGGSARFTNPAETLEPKPGSVTEHAMPGVSSVWSWFVWTSFAVNSVHCPQISGFCRLKDTRSGVHNQTDVYASIECPCKPGHLLPCSCGNDHRNTHPSCDMRTQEACCCKTGRCHLAGEGKQQPGYIVAHGLAAACPVRGRTLQGSHCQHLGRS